MQNIVYNCAKCGKVNATTYPSKRDFTPSQLGQKNREDPPISWVSRDLNMWIGLRKCKACKTWNIVVFVGWYFEKYGFSYLPYKTGWTGTLGPEIGKWCLDGMRKKEVKIPRSLAKE